MVIEVIGLNSGDDTREADGYVDRQGKEFIRWSNIGYTTMEVLPELKGKRWDGFALNLIRSVRPSVLRVIRYGHPQTTDGIAWRVTVSLQEGNRIVEGVVQEVEIGLRGKR